MTMDEDELRRLFGDIPLAAGVDAWRDRAHRGRPRVAIAAALLAVISVGVAVILFSRSDAQPPTVLPTTTSQTPTPPPTSRQQPTTSLPSSPSTPSATTTTTQSPAVKKHEGDLFVTAPNTVITDLQVTGTIYVRAANVSLTRVTVFAANQDFAIRQEPGATNLTVTSCELTGAEYGIRQEATGLTVRQCDIHNVRIGLAVSESATVTNNQIHDLSSPASSYGVYSGGGTGLTLTDNTITNQQPGGAAVLLDSVGGAYHDVLIQRNRLSGGQFTLHFGQSGGSSDIRVLGNRIGRGAVGYARDWDGAQPGNSWRDNVSLETGQALPAGG